MENLGPTLPQRLRRDVEWALRRALDPSDVLPMLHRLARTASPGSEESVFADRQLAELLAEKHPWRASIYAKRVVTHRPEDDRGWALLGLSQTLLGHYRFAVSAYQKALACAPKNPWYAHNLGHLLDVALDRAPDALYWLRAAYAGATGNGDVAASFAHALARTGRVAEAKRILGRAMKRGESKEHAALMRWLDRGAPADEDAGAPRSSGHARRAATKRVRAPRTTKRSASATAAAPLDSPLMAVEESLARGLESLPFDHRQRGAAMLLVKEAAQRLDDTEPAGVAAAIAYVIVYVDAVPLTQAEVAATFRVSAARLRSRFNELRAQLGLVAGDPRFATRPH